MRVVVQGSPKMMHLTHLGQDMQVQLSPTLIDALIITNFTHAHARTHTLNNLAKLMTNLSISHIIFLTLGSFMHD